MYAIFQIVKQGAISNVTEIGTAMQLRKAWKDLKFYSIDIINLLGDLKKNVSLLDENISLLDEFDFFHISKENMSDGLYYIFGLL